MDDTIYRRDAIDALGEEPLLWEAEDDYTLGRLTEWRRYKKALEALPSAQSGWIPCSERLPSEDEPFYVLCCDKYGAMMIGNVFECDDGETPYSAENENEYMYDCVAWMPLPEP